MAGRCWAFCSGEPKAMITGATIFSPIGEEVGTPAKLISMLKM